MGETDAAQKRVISWRFLVLVLLAVLAIFLAMRFDLRQLLRSALDWISGLGIWGPVIFVLVYVVASVLFVPASLLTLGAGAIFGVVRGTLFVIAGATLGATAAFLVARYFART